MEMQQSLIKKCGSCVLQRPVNSWASRILTLSRVAWAAEWPTLLIRASYIHGHTTCPLEEWTHAYALPLLPRSTPLQSHLSEVPNLCNTVPPVKHQWESAGDGFRRFGEDDVGRPDRRAPGLEGGHDLLCVLFVCGMVVCRSVCSKIVVMTFVVLCVRVCMCVWWCLGGCWGFPAHVRTSIHVKISYQRRGQHPRQRHHEHSQDRRRGIVVVGEEEGQGPLCSEHEEDEEGGERA